MDIIVINLAAEPQRWHDASRQFERLGLQASRHEAVDGQQLSPNEVRSLYSERLNRRAYHKPLLPREIGCYASHLAAWRALVESGKSALAVFEDDVEIDADLGRVLEALAESACEFDVAKLIGRSREQIAARRPLLDERDVIGYRRVPSLTGAYVIRASGARKLLAARLPFGRPVDVDLRHWWECDLRVVGVHPYPVRGAPASQFSTIGDRRCVARVRARPRKLFLQARYTAFNWLAARKSDASPFGLPVTPEAQRGSAAHPAAVSAAGSRPLPASASVGLPDAPSGPARPARRRNLVVLRAGDASLHRQWLDCPRRDFDLFISYYGKTPGRHREDADYYEERPGPKWPCLAELLAQHRALVQDYEAVWLPDDDLSADAARIDRMFAFFCAYGLSLAQPALTHDSYYTWDTLLQDRRCHIRYTGFVEVMAPIFSREALAVCAPTFAESATGWGLDWVWPGLCREAGLGPIAIIDATPVHHTRPVGGELYRNHPELDPRADAARILRRYRIDEVRAVAKYSFEGQVRDVALPLGERLMYWLKRLNGRRKHRAHA